MRGSRREDATRQRHGHRAPPPTTPPRRRTALACSGIAGPSGRRRGEREARLRRHRRRPARARTPRSAHPIRTTSHPREQACLRRTPDSSLAAARRATSAQQTRAVSRRAPHGVLRAGASTPARHPSGKDHSSSEAMSRGTRCPTGGEARKALFGLQPGALRRRRTAPVPRPRRAAGSPRDHRRRREPFAGGGAVYRREPSRQRLPTGRRHGSSPRSAAGGRPSPGRTDRRPRNEI